VPGTGRSIAGFVTVGARSIPSGFEHQARRGSGRPGAVALLLLGTLQDECTSV